jgi:hypothetical protein
VPPPTPAELEAILTRITARERTAKPCLATNARFSLHAARLQQEARAAALKRDWATVDLLVGQTRELGAANPWLGDVAGEMECLALGRDEQLFSKETAYSSSRMSNRLASNQESLSLGPAVPSFLRRKRAQGKAEPDATDNR